MPLSLHQSITHHPYYSYTNFPFLPIFTLNTFTLVPNAISTTRSFLHFSFKPISIDLSQSPLFISTLNSSSRSKLHIDLLPHTGFLAVPFPSRLILLSFLYTLIFISAIIVNDISFPPLTLLTSPVDAIPSQLLICQLSPFRGFHQQHFYPYALSHFDHNLISPLFIKTIPIDSSHLPLQFSFSQPKLTSASTQQSHNHSIQSHINPSSHSYHPKPIPSSHLQITCSLPFHYLPINTSALPRSHFHYYFY